MANEHFNLVSNSPPGQWINNNYFNESLTDDLGINQHSVFLLVEFVKLIQTDKGFQMKVG